MPLPKATPNPPAKKAAPRPAGPGVLVPGQGVPALAKALRRLVATKSWDVNQPLPTTRELGARYGISNTSACRLLMFLGRQGVIWRRGNGRYFLNESRRIYERRKPYACLLRKLQNWSRVYQGVMNGFSQVFGDDRTSMLFVQNQSLVRHADIGHPPVHAGAAEQKESLAEFFRDHAGGFRGILLDEVWLDEVLKGFPEELTNAVVVCRPTTVPHLSSATTDFEAGALLAIGHLYARGFVEIWLAIPFANSVSVERLKQAAVKCAARLGKPIDEKNIHPVATPADRERFLACLKNSRARTGVFCLEDNMTLLLRKAFEAAGLECPARVGLLSAMGTDLVTDRQISSVKIDYERIGHAAGELLSAGRHGIVVIPPQLSAGVTT